MPTGEDPGPPRPRFSSIWAVDKCPYLQAWILVYEAKATGEEMTPAIVGEEDGQVGRGLDPSNTFIPADIKVGPQVQPDLSEFCPSIPSQQGREFMALFTKKGPPYSGSYDSYYPIPKDRQTKYKRI